MKKIKCGKVKTDLTHLPNPMHLDAQIRFPHLVQKPKKGKGSYSRRQKHPHEDE